MTTQDARIAWRSLTAASLYTHKVRVYPDHGCRPGPCRGHREPRRRPAPDANVEPFVMPVARVTSPMNKDRRIRVYRDQARGRLTPRQLRRMAKAYREGV